LDLASEETLSAAPFVALLPFRHAASTALQGNVAPTGAGGASGFPLVISER